MHDEEKRGKEVETEREDLYKKWVIGQGGDC